MPQSIQRRQWIQQTAGACASLFLPSTLSATARQKKPPNIVFIMADDLGYGHLGCYGQTKIRTPHIDRLAKEGMRFTQCYAGAPVCAPSRSVLMTGFHTGHTSVRGNSGGLPILPDDITVGEVLQKAGYKTGIFGKWGLGDFDTTGVPNKQGFDEFFGYLHQVHAHFYYPYFLWKNDQKFLLPGNEGGKRQQYSHDVIMDHALTFVKENKDHPFFLYLPFTIPHLELLVPQDSLDEYKGKFPETEPYKSDHYADQPYPRAALAGMITRMDRDVGRLMALLKELNLDDNTVVFFTSDNGAQGGHSTGVDFFNATGPLRGAKGTLYEGGLRVPMIARWPGNIQAGTKSDHIWAFEDVLPTLADIAGAKVTHSIDGVSVLPTLVGSKAAGEKQKVRPFYYWESSRYRQAVRMGDWKAVRPGRNKPLELYNLKQDIGETTNVANKYPEIVQQIEDYLKTARTEPRTYKKEKPTWSYKPEDTGYVR